MSTLKLYEDLRLLCGDAAGRLFAAINGISILTHLHLYLSTLPYGDLPIIAQLGLAIHFHRQLEQLKISWTMPNVEAIEFDLYFYSKCTDCTIKRFSDDYLLANHTIFKNCLRQIFVPLKRTCTKLHAILHHYEKVLSSAEELLAE